MHPKQRDAFYSRLLRDGVAHVRLKLAQHAYTSEQEPYVRLWLGDCTVEPPTLPAPHSMLWTQSLVGQIAIGVAVTVIGGGVTWLATHVL